jgi:hypothetical protein
MEGMEEPVLARLPAFHTFVFYVQGMEPKIFEPPAQWQPVPPGVFETDVNRLARQGIVECEYRGETISPRGAYHLRMWWKRRG